MFLYYRVLYGLNFHKMLKMLEYFTDISLKYPRISISDTQRKLKYRYFIGLILHSHILMMYPSILYQIYIINRYIKQMEASILYNKKLSKSII